MGSLQASRSRQSITIYLFPSLLVLSVWGYANDVTLTQSTTNPVTLTVINGCSLNSQQATGINLGTLDFGNYFVLNTVIDAKTTAGNGDMQIRCSPGTRARIRLDKGIHGTSISDRRMKHASLSNTVQYQLYTSAARTTVWNDTTGTTIDFNDDTPVNVSVYGRIPIQTSPPSGVYTDQVVVTLEIESM